jgi:imidazole glycerol-phosphate synthase subunit HisH
VSTRIGIVNYGMGNLRSVEKALERVGASPTISATPEELGAADGLILPGVGAFPAASERIAAAGLDGFLRDRAAAGVPILGVCLGMQLLFDSSTEHGGAAGLGLLSGPVERLEPGELKLPHIGWSPLRIERESPLTEGVPDGEPFYFVHSFVPRPQPGERIASAEHGERFAALVGSHPIYGAQFHPEKSSAAGLRLLRNFAAICAPVGAGASR